MSILLVPREATAKPPAPPSLKVRSGTVHSEVDLIITSGKKYPAVILELERDEGEGFHLLAQVEGPQRKQLVTDGALPPGSYSYRARIISKRRASRWSRIASIYVDNPPAPPINEPTPAPLPYEHLKCNALALAPDIAECEAGFEEQVVALTNDLRAAAGIPPLRINPQLNCSSRSHNMWMIQNNNFSHEGWFDTIIASGYGGSTMAQNIAVGYTSPGAVVLGWFNSPGHRMNMFYPFFVDIGVSCLSRNGRLWWTQDFGG